MILFQEEGQTVTFEPTFVDGPRSWHERLLALYILCILIFLLIRIAQLYLTSRTLQKTMKIPEDGANDWRHLWEQSKTQAHSLSKVAFLTLILCLWEVSMSLTDILMEFGTRKASFSNWAFIDFAQRLTPVSAGLLISSALYACGFFFESRLGRHKLAHDRALPATD